MLGILGLIDPKPGSGYDIKRVIDGTISHFWSESYGQIYPVLRQMATQGLVTARAIRQKGRKRTGYAMTSKGRKILQAWLQKTPQPTRMRDELILKLLFGNQTNPATLIRHLQDHRQHLAAAAAEYSGWLDQARGQKNDYTPFQVMILRAGITLSEAFVRWADESVATLQRMKQP